VRTFLFTAIAGALIALFLSAGCDNKDNPSGSLATSPVGTWKSITADTTKILVVRTDNTFAFNVNCQYPIADSGTYTYSGDSLIFSYLLCTQTYDGGAPEGIPCIPNENTGKISGDKLIISDGSGITATLTKQ
jgi:hypothetical protein